MPPEAGSHSPGSGDCRAMKSWVDDCVNDGVLIEMRETQSASQSELPAAILVLMLDASFSKSTRGTGCDGSVSARSVHKRIRRCFEVLVGVLWEMLCDAMN